MTENDRKQTAYRVLVPVTRGESMATDDLRAIREEVDVGAWREVDTFRASGDLAAIKAAEEAHGPFDHGAVAVPVRNWRPRTVKDETVRRRSWT